MKLLLRRGTGILTMCLLLLLMAGSALAGNTTDFMDGSGTEEDPYLISNVTHLQNVSKRSSSHFLLMKDLSLENTTFQLSGFSGVFDGGGHTISGLSDSFVSYLSGELKNLTLSGTASTGLAAATVGSGGKIINCHSEGCVSGKDSVGGLAGVSSGLIDRCSNRAEVKVEAFSGWNYVGGIVGEQLESGTVTRSYNLGTVTSQDGSAYLGDIGSSGGIVGGGGVVTDCFNLGRIAGEADSVLAGGICGSGAIPVRCYNLGQVSGCDGNDYVGGIAGMGHSSEFALFSRDHCYYVDLLDGLEMEGTTCCTVQEMQRQETFSGFDFETVWRMDPEFGLPMLRDNPFELSENTTEFTGGNGTFYFPFEIATQEQLERVDSYPQANFKVVKDIALDGEWTPLCSDGFKGVFDGGGYTISGLTCYLFSDTSDGEREYAGLFAWNKGVIRNVTLADVSLYARASGQDVNAYVGAVAAASHNGVFENCHVIGGSCYAGVYYSDRWGSSGWWTPSCGTAYAGGICGYSAVYTTNDRDGIFVNCTNAASISSDSRAGGVCGEGGSFTGCENSGSVSVCAQDNGKHSGYAYVAGGITSGSGSGDISDCVNTGAVNVTNTIDEYNCVAGGIAGSSGNTISTCWNSGTVTVAFTSKEATGYCGGIVGNGYTVEDCVNSGDALEGAGTPIKICYRGGIAGIGRSVSRCYSTSLLPEVHPAWPRLDKIVAPYDGYETTVTDCYFMDCSDGRFAVHGLPRTEEELRTEAGYEGFDFEMVWGFDPFSDYPYALPKNLFEKITEVTLVGGSIELETVEGVWPDLSGLTVTLKSTSGKSDTVMLERWMLPDVEISRAGKQTVGIKYSDCYSEQTVTLNIREKAPVSLSVAKLPTKSSYLQYIGELKLTGGTFTVHYDNGTEETLSMKADGVQVTGFDNTVPGPQQLTLTYGELSVSFQITVAGRIGLQPSGGYACLQGQQLPSDWFDLSILYEDGTRLSVDYNQVTLTYDTSTAGSVPVTISYQDMEITTKITVYPSKAIDLVLTEPTKLSYLMGEELNLTGGKLTVTLAAANGEMLTTCTQEVPLGSSMISGYDPFLLTWQETSGSWVASTQEVTVSYGGIQTTFLVRINPIITSISRTPGTDGQKTTVGLQVNKSVNTKGCKLWLAAYSGGQMISCVQPVGGANYYFTAELPQLPEEAEYRLFILGEDLAPRVAAASLSR